jgi:hypothetical protein
MMKASHTLFLFGKLEKQHQDILTKIGVQEEDLKLGNDTLYENIAQMNLMEVTLCFYRYRYLIRLRESTERFCQIWEYFEKRILQNVQFISIFCGSKKCQKKVVYFDNQ